MNESFASTLALLRKNANLTDLELAELANVPRSLISGLQNGSRCVGELQARRIGAALKLSGEKLERFVFLAINTCTEKVLKASRAYPAELLNVLAQLLRGAGILPDQIAVCRVQKNAEAQDITLLLNSGEEARIQTHLTCA